MSDATRRTIRTTFQALIGLCALVPLLIVAIGDDSPPGVAAAMAAALAVSTAVTRVMAIPAVDAWIWRFLPWLSMDGDQ